MMTCPAGHLAKRKEHNKANEKRKVFANFTYYFDVEKCKNCHLREGCYKPGAKTKSYQQTILPNLHKKHLEFEKTKEFKEKMKLRYIVEAKNADFKHNYAMGCAQSYGLEYMTLQTAMSIFACNLKRIFRLTSV